jgi:hypothetical protein
LKCGGGTDAACGNECEKLENRIGKFYIFNHFIQFLSVAIGISIKWDFFGDVSFLGYTFGYIMIRMDVRILQISQIGTDFF